MLRSLAALSLLIPMPTAPAVVPHALIDPASIVQVICPVTDGYYAGTAFRIGNGLELSVNHVTQTGTCTIGGVPVKLAYVMPKGDFSMIHGDTGPSLKVDCGGFVKDRKYLAIGYARGLPFLTTVELVGTGESDDGMALLAGIFTVVPGQSGGPIVDELTGAVVGTVNTYDMENGLSGSIPLKDTPVCRNRIA